MQVEEAPLLSLAASGDGEAFAILRDTLLAAGNQPGALIPREELALQAEVFARLAAEHSAMDKLALAAMLSLRAQDEKAKGNEARATAFLAEVNGIFDEVLVAGDHAASSMLARCLSLLADDGNDNASILLERLVALLSPERAAAVCSEVRRLDHVERA